MLARNILAAILLSLPAVVPAQTPPPTVNAMSATECEVWNRERSFARTVESSDAAAFRAHLHPGAVFIGGRDAVSRGADAVLRDWAPIIQGEGMRLRWYPRHVVIGGDPETAHSRGPYWIENLAPDAEPRFVVGQFVSIWRRVEGEWVVLFDGGGGSRPEAATAEAIAELEAGLDPVCPLAK